MYRAEKKYLQILLSRTQAGPGRKVKQEQEKISRNHVPRLFLGSVHLVNGLKVIIKRKGRQKCEMFEEAPRKQLSVTLEILIGSRDFPPRQLRRAL